MGSGLNITLLGGRRSRGSRRRGGEFKDRVDQYYFTMAARRERKVDGRRGNNAMSDSEG
jgi:hypothetical protein